MLVFPFVWISAQINNCAEIGTKGNTNIKNSLYQIFDTDKSRADKVHRIKYMHKRKRSLIHNSTMLNAICFHRKKTDIFQPNLAPLLLSLEIILRKIHNNSHFLLGLSVEAPWTEQSLVVSHVVTKPG